MNIIAQLQGGLGNQLFQYATAKALANHYGATLELDTAWFMTTHHNVTKRSIELTHLQIEAQIVCQSPLRTRPKTPYRIAQEFLPINPYILSETTPHLFSNEINELSLYPKQNLYLLGYWQAYKYFSHIQGDLVRQIQPKNSLNSSYQNFHSLIKSNTSGMVHIRRGDYIDLPAASKVHGFLGLDYYIQGMAIFLEQNPTIQFFVFSDDIPWARGHLPFQERITFVEVSPELESVTQELYLMSQCQFHLIANSSLSWWGAWLAHEESSLDKVICPAHWTNDREMNWNDLLPPNWSRI
jgi:hypothetical protein